MNSVRVSQLLQDLISEIDALSADVIDLSGIELKETLDTQTTNSAIAPILEQ